MSGTAAAESANAATTAQSAAYTPSGTVYGDIRDIKHVVILMQENRSFDHYFGSLRGVQGFGDKATILLPGGRPVWQQPATAPGQPVTSTQYPWPLSSGTFSGTQPPSPEQGAQNYGGTDHSWESQDGAWYGGFMNGWQYAKDGPTTLGFLARHDLPFHYALADAYTIGGAYHCSILSATGPNRTTLWSGSINAGEQNGTFVAYNGGDELSNSAPFAGRSAHFSVYDNTLSAPPPVANYPAGFPGQYTVAPSPNEVRTVTATGPVSAAGAYDITVIGPNRFLRRFTGDATKAGAKVTVDAEYYHSGFHPKFVLNLVNGASAAVNFTVTTNRYGTSRPVQYHVPAGKTTQHNIDPLTSTSGWYDLTVTIDADSSWSQRFTGHVETGQASITG